MKPIYVVFLTLVLFSCSNKNEDADLQELSQKSLDIQTGLADSAVTQSNSEERGAGEKRKPRDDNRSAPPADWTQKIIKTANIRLELKDYNGFNTSVHHSLAGFGAYIAQEQQQEDDIQINNELSIKVPVEQFENLVNYLTADKKNKILEKQITSADVTAEFADTRSRMETKKQVREKYHQFMSNASKIDDVLRLQSEINAITEDIEAAAGRVKYLSHQSAYSTINLRYFQVLDASKKTDEEPAFLHEIGSAFRSGAVFLAELLVVLISVWPLLIVFGAAWFIARKKGWLRSKPQLNKQ